MLQTKVILSRVTNLSDARYASGMGVDYIGFSINPESKEYVTVEQAKSISDWLSGVSIIGDIGNSLTTQMVEYSASYIQTSDISIISELEEPILALAVNTSNIGEVVDSLAKFSDKVSFFILKVEAELLHNLQDELRDLCKKHQIYISVEFDNQILGSVLSDIKPEGIVIYGSNEEKPGLSSYDGIANILEQLEEEG